MLVDLPSEVRCINAAIALTSDKKFIVVACRSILWEPQVPLLECGKGVLGSRHVAVSELSGRLDLGEADASG